MNALCNSSEFANTRLIDTEWGPWIVSNEVVQGIGDVVVDQMTFISR
jgi:hypothetical protein